MSGSSSHLLRMLEPAVRPMGAPQPRAVPRHPIETERFDQLLAAAAAGSLTSGRQIQAPQDIASTLDAAQLERLATAADRAEALGARRALMFMDGRAFIVDVPQRTIVSELNESASIHHSNVDVAMHVSGQQISEINLHSHRTQMDLLKRLQQHGQARPAM